MSNSRDQPTDPTADERTDLDSTRESPEEAAREEDHAKGGWIALEDSAPDPDDDNAQNDFA